MYKFLSGQKQLAPRWFYKLPWFLQPIYVGSGNFKWLGIRFHPKNSLTGDTLFMSWRREIMFGKRSPDKFVIEFRTSPQNGCKTDYYLAYVDGTPMRNHQPDGHWGVGDTKEGALFSLLEHMHRLII